jgi:hypothetical protein
LKTLEVRRMQLDLTAVYKIIFGFMNLDSDLFFNFRLTDDDFKIYPKHIGSKHRNLTQLNTLASRTYKMWNNLPKEMRFSPSVDSFKYKLKKYDLHDRLQSKITW